MKYSLDEAELLYATDRSQWRAWLKKHHASEKEAWLVFYKKHTGKQGLSYNDAVEEALCFGWIDSTVKTIDEDSYRQRFTPRRPKSSYSQANLERLRYLAGKGLVADDVLEKVSGLLKQKFTMPPDIIDAIKKNDAAWENFQGFSPSYIRIRLAFIDGARDRPEVFLKRLSYFIKMSEKNKLFGYGGIEKYY